MSQIFHNCVSTTLIPIVQYFSRNWNVEEFMNKTPEFNSTVRDIEDLVKFGEERTLCPYFLSREMAASADLVFMPYNYLVDVKTRGKLGISWKNAVLIFDEAHNVEVRITIFSVVLVLWKTCWKEKYLWQSAFG